jgi:hypothetical protein
MPRHLESPELDARRIVKVSAPPPETGGAVATMERGRPALIAPRASPRENLSRY